MVKTTIDAQRGIKMPKESHEAEGCHSQVARGVREEAVAIEEKCIKNQRARNLSEAKDSGFAISEAEIRKRFEAKLKNREIYPLIELEAAKPRRVCGRLSDSLYGKFSTK
jgi:hypothetical protein